jgi:hypothetical protein
LWNREHLTTYNAAMGLTSGYDQRWKGRRPNEGFLDNL